ncbi:MAG: 50S ribosomal protein L24 [Candidatus Glassbacteria bacterium]|nr:50S ribosomal protein L24 [Candidatus Glassbacteria bacterium]
MRIVKGDKVVVVSGNYKGQTGEVLMVLPKAGRVIVKGLNMVKRHTKPTQKTPQGGIVEKEAPMNLCKVMLWDDKAGKGTRVSSRKLDDERGSKVRISVVSGEVIETKAAK